MPKYFVIVYYIIIMFEKIIVAADGSFPINYDGLSCPHCGKVIDVFKRCEGEKAARELGVDFFGAIPLDADIGTLGDQGLAFTGQGTMESVLLRR
jgi:hypothetical protein